MIFLLASSQNACSNLSDMCEVPHKTFLIEDSTDLELFFKTKKSDILVVSGAKLLKRFGMAGRVPKNRAVGSMRHKEHVFDDKSWFFIHDPYLAKVDYQVGVELDLDLKLVERLYNTGTTDPEVGEYRYVEDLTDVCDFVESHWETTGEALSASTDLETVGLDYIDSEAWIVSISFTVEEGYSDVVYFKGLGDQPKPGDLLFDQIDWLLNTEKVKLQGANLKYDMNWILSKWGIDCSNFTFDTNLVGSLLDENMSNSLNIHAKRNTTMGGYDDAFNDTYDKGKMHEVPKDALLPYAGGDTDATQRVAKVFKGKILQDNALVRFYVRLLHPAVRAFESVEQEGILIDTKYYFELQRELEVEIASLEQEALKLMSPFIRYKYHGEDSKGRSNLRLSRGVIIKDFMFGPRGLNLKPKKLTPKSGDPSTAMEHLVMFSDNPKAKRFIEILKKYNSATKTLSTYVNGFLEHLCEDNRFHPSFAFFRGFGENSGHDTGTVTGRASAVGPAVQCMTAETGVLTESEGYVAVLEIIQRFEVGEPFRVLSHTGHWRRVTDVCYNGTHTIYKVTTESGKVLRCTANHPIMSQYGWVRADMLVPGEYLMIKEETDGEVCSRTQATREDSDPDTVGREAGDLKRCFIRQIKASFGGRCPELWPSESWATFDRVIGIEKELPEETYGIAVDVDHSHVTNGIVSHNTVPKHTIWAKKLRMGYIAPPGFKVVNWDFSQGELRICADISNEETMIRLYAEGLDQHMVTGGALLGYSVSDMLEMETADPVLFKTIRQNGKAGNFGLIYGMSAKGFQEYARITFGVSMTLQEAEAKRDAFFNLYPGLEPWHDRQIKMAYQTGQVRNPFGRVRHLPMIYSKDSSISSKAQRQAINSPVQSALSDMTIYSLAKVRQKYGRPEDCRFHCFTHDSLTAYVRDESLGIWVPRVKEIMETLPLEEDFGWKSKVFFAADAEVGNTWADLMPYDKWLALEHNKVHFSKEAGAV